MITFFESGLSSLNIHLSEEIIEKFFQYLTLLEKWSKVYNLTAVNDPKERVVLHLLDSLSVAPYVKGTHVIDVGTGGGLPGIPLALNFPKVSFTLLDSNGKKTRFLQQVVHELSLENVTVVHSRVEGYNPESLFDTVLSRAFSSISSMLNQTAHLCARTGQFLAMKGTVPQQEIAEISPSFQVVRVIPLQVPSLTAERHLVVIEFKNKDTHRG